MKIFKILALLTISLFVFTGCENEEITNYAFQDISAPENVTAAFDVSQDDSGTVTITPSGDGASVFQVDLGNGETAELAAGESVTTVYAEGQYMVNIVAVGPTGLKSEFNQMLNISFKAPENLMISIDQPETNPSTITVSATADNTTLFQVYFGDVEDEEPTQLMPGESVTHSYSDPGVYELTVIAIGAGAATAEEDEIIIIPEPTDPLKLPITFDGGTVNYAMSTFGGASFEVVTNPDLSGANAEESKVGALTNSGSEWEGGSFVLGTPIDFGGANKVVTMKMWSDVEISVLMKFEGGVDDARANEVKVTHGGTGWEDLAFDFGTNATKSFIDGTQGVGEPFVPTGQYETLTLFIDGGGFTAGTFYLDDIVFSSMDPAPSPTAPAGEVQSIFSDAYDDPAGVNYYPNWGQTTTFEIVSISGNEAIKYGNVNYQGIDIGENIDATAYNYINIDVYSGDYTEIPFYLISSSGEEAVTLNLTPNEWNTIQIPLTEYTDQGLDISDVFQFKFDVQPDTGGAFYIDNLYFSTNAAVASEPTSAAPAPTADAADVISIFSDEYTDPSGINYYPNWGQNTTYEMVTLDGESAIKYANMNYQGIEFGEAFDLTGYSSVKIDVWSGDYTSIAFFLISQASGENAVDLNITPNTWTTIEIPLSDFTSQGLSVDDIHQIKFDVNPDAGGTFYIDNLYFQK